MADYIEVSRVINAWRKRDYSGKWEQYNRLFDKISGLKSPLHEPTSREVLRVMEEDLGVANGAHLRARWRKESSGWVRK